MKKKSQIKKFYILWTFALMLALIEFGGWLYQGVFSLIPFIILLIAAYSLYKLKDVKQ